MKRFLLLLFALALCLSTFSGCDNSAKDNPGFSSSLIKKEDAGYAITLPVTKEKVFLREEYESYLPKISDELVKIAEEKILEHFGDKYKEDHFYLSKDQEGFLCLGMEIIVEIEPPTDAQDLGCGVDHKHLIYKERITK